MSDFDRLRPRANGGPDGGSAVPAPSEPGRVPGPRADREGRRALFSAEVPDAAPAISGLVPGGLVSVSCSRCGATSRLGACQAIAAATPSLHLPILRRRYPSWMRCPACQRRTWVRVSLRRS